MSKCQLVETELAQRAARDQTINGRGRGAALHVVSACESHIGAIGKLYQNSVG
jgi:hypothetical protein